MICTLHISYFYWGQMWVGTPKRRVGTIEQPLKKTKSPPALERGSTITLMHCACIKGSKKKKKKKKVSRLLSVGHSHAEANSVSYLLLFLCPLQVGSYFMHLVPQDWSTTSFHMVWHMGISWH